MRSIKFRGKRVDNGEWIYGDLMTYDNDYVICDVDDGGYLPIVRETVGQFTGLYDKNGTEIYEGDIIKAINEYNGGTNIGEVHFEDFTWFGAKDYLSNINEWCVTEIIGNIHDNKEIK